MITLTIQATTLPELHRLLAEHVGLLAPSPREDRSTMALLRAHHETVHAAPAAPVEAAPAAPVEAAPAAPVEVASPVAYSDVQKAVFELASAKGKPAVLAVFEALGIAHAKELAEDRWPEALAALKAAAGAA